MKGISGGPDFISGEQLVFCDAQIFYRLSMLLFNALLVHTYLPDDFIPTLVIPLVG